MKVSSLLLNTMLSKRSLLGLHSHDTTVHVSPIWSRPYLDYIVFFIVGKPTACFLVLSCYSPSQHTLIHTHLHLSLLIITHTSTPLLSLPSSPLHVLHGGVCVGLWKQLGLIIDVLHFNQFYHSVRLIKVSSILPGAVCVSVHECVCVWQECVCFPVPGGSTLHFISENTWEISISGIRDEIEVFSLPLPVLFSLSLSVSPPPRSPGRILNAINTAALLPANY